MIYYREELSSTILFDILLGRDFYIGINIHIIFHNNSFEFECPEMNREINYIFSIEISEDRKIVM